jgi:hypothetical protein
MVTEAFALEPALVAKLKDISLQVRNVPVDRNGPRRKEIPERTIPSWRRVVAHRDLAGSLLLLRNL